MRFDILKNPTSYLYTHTCTQVYWQIEIELDRVGKRERETVCEGERNR